MDNLIEIPQCKVPLCENPQAIFKRWPMCVECMDNTIKRFKVFLPHADTQKVTDHIIQNIDMLVKAEQAIIDKQGVNYDRDSLGEPDE